MARLRARREGPVLCVSLSASFVLQGLTRSPSSFPLTPSFQRARLRSCGSGASPSVCSSAGVFRGTWGGFETEALPRVCCSLGSVASAGRAAPAPRAVLWRRGQPCSRDTSPPPPGFRGDSGRSWGDTAIDVCVSSKRQSQAACGVLSPPALAADQGGAAAPGALMTCSAGPAGRSRGRDAGGPLAPSHLLASVQLAPRAGGLEGPSPWAPSQCPGPLAGVALSVAGWAPGERSEAMGPSPAAAPGDGLAGWASMWEAGHTQGLPPRMWRRLALHPRGPPEGRRVWTQGGFSCSVLALRVGCLSCSLALCRQPCEGSRVLATAARRGAWVNAGDVLGVTARPPQPLQEPSRGWCCGWPWSGHSPGLTLARARGASW